VKFARSEITVLLVPLAVYVLTLHAYEYGPLFNVVATQFSMWKYHTFTLGALNVPANETILNPDIFPYNGLYYDVYPPGLTLLSFPFATLGIILDGGVMKNTGFAVLLVEFFVALCAAFASLLVFRICRWYAEVPQSMLASFVLAFGTLVWPFGTATYYHDVCLVFSLASVYFAMRYFRGTRSVYNLVLSGICLGISSLVDYVSILFVIPLLAYLFYSFKGKIKGVFMLVKTFCLFLLPFLLVASVNLLYNYILFGSFTTFPAQFYIYASVPPGNGVTGVFARFDLIGLPEHLVYNLISPYRGILLFSPVLALGFYGMYKMVRRKDLRIDAIFLSLFFLTNFVAYSAWGAWDGGNSYGPRFLIYGLPYLVIRIGLVLYQNRRVYLKALFLALFSFSTIVQGLGAFTYANQPPSNSVLVYQPFIVALPELLSGQLGVWWFQPGLITDQIIAGSILVGIFILIFSFTVSITKKENPSTVSKMITSPPSLSRPDPFP
jgi:hypothetical protein